MMSRRCYYYRVSDADVIDYPSSLATGPSHDVVRSTGTLLTPEPALYVDVRYQLPYLPDVVHFALLGPSSSTWFPAPRSKARMELSDQSSGLFMR
ncbi:hypothetical protein CsSME_00010749 [Camellia sinensis var. sinensis]